MFITGGAGSEKFMVAAWVGFFDSLIAVALVLAGLTGAHWGLTAPFFGFQLFAYGLVFGVISLILGLIGLLLTGRPELRGAHGRAVLASYLGAILTALLVYLMLGVKDYPAINDVTTDVDNPPEFVHAPTLPQIQGHSLAYDKARYARRQQMGYGALQGLQLPADPDQAFKTVTTLASDMHRWQITYVDPKTHVLEGVATTPVFRFQDDFVIQVRPAPNGSLVEMRSRSSDRQFDLGSNYNRINAFFKMLAASGAPH
jgi:uncharacterized protein (DUF1499 family)